MKVLHFVPIGYNIRLLEAMFHELYDAVDYFVLYETDATQIGVRKEMFYDKTKERWAKFHDKIIHLTDHIDDSMANSVCTHSVERPFSRWCWPMTRPIFYYAQCTPPTLAPFAHWTSCFCPGRCLNLWIPKPSPT